MTLKINHSETELSGSSRQGEIETSYQTLLEKFGEPMAINGEDIAVEWKIQEGDVIASISDYGAKTYPKYTTVWHVGGFSKEALELVNSILKN